MKNCNMSDLDKPASRKFGMVMCVDPPNHVCIYNFMLLNIQQHGQLPSGKYKNKLSLKSFGPIPAEF